MNEASVAKWILPSLKGAAWKLTAKFLFHFWKYQSGPKDQKYSCYWPLALWSSQERKMSTMYVAGKSSNCQSWMHSIVPWTPSSTHMWRKRPNQIKSSVVKCTFKNTWSYPQWDTSMLRNTEPRAKNVDQVMEHLYKSWTKQDFCLV
jgi:hypothetical protein